MNDEQLKQLALQLNIELPMLQKIYERFKPKDSQQLIKIVNDVNATKSDVGSDDMDSILNFYETQQNRIPQVELPTEPIPGQPVESGQPGQQAPASQAASINFDQVYGQGYQFTPKGPDDLTGQCAWFAEQITRLPDGSTWTIGNTIDEKRARLQQHRASGNAFVGGEAPPEVGNSVVLDTGTPYGHVAVVSEVLPDGRIRLTESNWNNDQRVRHDRVIDPKDKSIVGFVKSKPTQEFKVEPPKTSPATPTTPVTPQQPVATPQGKQELPEEEQPVKPQDIAAQNPNAQRIETQAPQTKPVVPSQTDPTVPKKGAIGFLDVFNNPSTQSAQKELYSPPIIRKPPEIKPPAITPRVEPQAMRPPSATASAVTPPRPITPMQPRPQMSMQTPPQPQMSRQLPMPKPTMTNTLQNVGSTISNWFRK